MDKIQPQTTLELETCSCGSDSEIQGKASYRSSTRSRVPATCPPGFQGRYTVRSGDSMFLIAQRFGVSLQSLINANPHIPNPSRIFPGDVLCVPGVTPPVNGRVPATCPPGFQGRYTVRPGDSMFLIAQRFGVSLQSLINANPHISNPSRIFPGDVLCVPGVTPPVNGRVPATCPPGFTGRYTVRPGDSMFTIAQRFGISQQQLIAANPHISDPTRIFPGDVLCVPGGRIPASCPPGFNRRYVVVPGDTMFLVARRFGVSQQRLINANPHITNPNILNPGDVLCVPGTMTQALEVEEANEMNAMGSFNQQSSGRVPKTCPSGVRYTVKPGDSMFFIAQRFGISLKALIGANPHIANPAEIFPGDVLCIPIKSADGRVPGKCPKGFGGRYTVRSGDSMFLIAKRFGVSLETLIAANPHISNPAEIFPGDVLCVPKYYGMYKPYSMILNYQEE